MTAPYLLDEVKLICLPVPPWMNKPLHIYVGHCSMMPEGINWPRQVTMFPDSCVVCMEWRTPLRPQQVCKAPGNSQKDSCFRSQRQQIQSITHIKEPKQQTLSRQRRSVRAYNMPLCIPTTTDRSPAATRRYSYSTTIVMQQVTCACYCRAVPIVCHMQLLSESCSFSGPLSQGNSSVDVV